MTLTRFWFTFELSLSDAHPPGVLMGCGVTAHDEQEALRILKERVFRDYLFPRVKKTIKDVDISTLDQ